MQGNAMLRRHTARAVLAGGLALACLLAGTPAASSAPSDAAFTDIPIQETGRVELILDGDTFRFREDGASSWVKIRLLGVNTPEVTGAKGGRVLGAIHPK